MPFLKHRRKSKSVKRIAFNLIEIIYAEEMVHFDDRVQTGRGKMCWRNVVSCFPAEANLCLDPAIAPHQLALMWALRCIHWCLNMNLQLTEQRLKCTNECGLRKPQTNLTSPPRDIQAAHSVKDFAQHFRLRSLLLMKIDKTTGVLFDLTHRTYRNLKCWAGRATFHCAALMRSPSLPLLLVGNGTEDDPRHAPLPSK